MELFAQRGRERESEDCFTWAVQGGDGRSQRTGVGLLATVGKEKEKKKKRKRKKKKRKRYFW
jgi:hypothetical protein